MFDVHPYVSEPWGLGRTLIRPNGP